MKRIISIVILFLFAFEIHAQGTKNFQNFHIEGGRIIWQKVYYTDMTPEQIKTFIITSEIFEHVNIIDQTLITARLPRQFVNYEAFGFRTMKLPLYVLNNYLGPAHANIEIREGRYRITLKDIILSPLSPIKTMTAGPIEDVTISNGSFDSYFIEYGGPIYDAVLTPIFYPQKNTDDW